MLASSLVVIILYSFWLVELSTSECLQCKGKMCDENNNCLKGCIPGFAGRKCMHECPEYCIESLCDYEEKHGNFPCSIGCKPGYHGLQCKTPCQTFDEDGKCDRFTGTAPDCQGIKYGGKCETSCQRECGGSVCDNKGHCYKAVCIPGRCGSDCKGNCPTDEVCHKEIEDCVLPNEEKDVQKNSECSCDPKGTTGERAGYEGFFIVINAVCSILFIITWIAFVVAFIKIYQKLLRQSIIGYKKDESMFLYQGEDLRPGLRRRTPVANEEETDLIGNH